MGNPPRRDKVQSNAIRAVCLFAALGTAYSFVGSTARVFSMQSQGAADIERRTEPMIPNTIEPTKMLATVQVRRLVAST